MRLSLILLLILLVSCSQQEPAAPEAANKTESIRNETESPGIEVSQLSEFQELVDFCYFNPVLKKGETFRFPAWESHEQITLLDFRQDDPEFSVQISNLDGSRQWTVSSWAETEIAGTGHVMPIRLLHSVRTGQGEYRIVPYLIRDNEVHICIVTDEEFNTEFCDSFQGVERTLCFDKLGFNRGIDVCDSVREPEDRDSCIRGAKDIAG